MKKNHYNSHSDAVKLLFAFSSLASVIAIAIFLTGNANAQSYTCSGKEVCSGSPDYLCSAGLTITCPDCGPGFTGDCGPPPGTFNCGPIGTNYCNRAETCRCTALPPINGVCNNAVLNGCSSPGPAINQAANACNNTWVCQGQNGGANSLGCQINQPDGPNVSCGAPGVCSLSCGGGSQTVPVCSAGSCSTVSQSCNTQACPVNGVCNNAVLNGCSSPGPAINQAANACNNTWVCQGQNGGANSLGCQINQPNGVNAACGGPGVCSLSCGGGTQSLPGCSAGSCSASVSTQSCNTQACPVNGVCNNAVPNGCSSPGPAINQAANACNNTWVCQGQNGGSDSLSCQINQADGTSCGAPGVCSVSCGGGSQTVSVCSVGSCSAVSQSCNSQPCPINGVCGPDDGGTFSSLSPVDPNLCSVGPVSGFSGSGPWNWQCDGQFGGSPSLPCAATVIPPTCSASPPTINYGSSATFTAGAGNGSYTWSAPAGSPLIGNGLSFIASFSTAGTQTVTVTSGGKTGSCSVTVNAPAGISLSTPGGPLDFTASCVPASSLPTVTISFDTPTITVGQTADLSWSSTNSSGGCTASGAWSGSQATAGGPIPESPAVAGTYTYALTCNNGIGGSTTNSATLTVNPAVANTGMIVVNSTNAMTGQPLPSSWIFPVYPSTDPCATGPCINQQSVTYVNQPTPGGVAGYTLGIVANSAGILYALKGVDTKLVLRENHDIFSLAFWKNALIRFAEAVTVGPCSGGSVLCGLTLGSGGTIVFNPQWDPIAQMTVVPVSPAPVAITNTAPGTFTVSNTGAPGSVLNWSVASITYSSGSNWLLVSPSNPISAAGSQSPTVTYNGTLPPGPYSATLIINGVSSPTGQALPSQSVTVNLTVSAAGLSCSPNSQVVNIAQPSSPMTATGGSGTYTWTAPPDGIYSGSPAPWTGNPFIVNYPTVGPKTVTVNDGVSTASCTVNVINISCIFAASPTNIIPPSQSTLSWTCVNVTACSIDQGIGAVTNPLSGNVNVSPTSTTVYTLSCTGAGSASYSTPVTVNVVRPQICETNPLDPLCVQ